MTKCDIETWRIDWLNKKSRLAAQISLACPQSVISIFGFLFVYYSSLASTANTPYSSLSPLRSSCVFRLVEAPLGAPHIDSHHGHVLTSTRSCSWSEEQCAPSRTRSLLSPLHHCCLHSLLMPLLLTSIGNTKLFLIAFLLFRFWFERIKGKMS